MSENASATIVVKNTTKIRLKLTIKDAGGKKTVVSVDPKKQASISIPADATISVAEDSTKPGGGGIKA